MIFLTCYKHLLLLRIQLILFGYAIPFIWLIYQFIGDKLISLPYLLLNQCQGNSWKKLDQPVHDLRYFYVYSGGVRVCCKRQHCSIWLCYTFESGITNKFMLLLIPPIIRPGTMAEILVIAQLQSVSCSVLYSRSRSHLSWPFVLLSLTDWLTDWLTI